MSAAQTATPTEHSGSRKFTVHLRLGVPPELRSATQQTIKGRIQANDAAQLLVNEAYSALTALTVPHPTTHASGTATTTAAATSTTTSATTSSVSRAANGGTPLLPQIDDESARESPEWRCVLDRTELNILVVALTAHLDSVREFKFVASHRPDQVTVPPPDVTEFRVPNRTEETIVKWDLLKQIFAHFIPPEGYPLIPLSKCIALVFPTPKRDKSKALNGVWLGSSEKFEKFSINNPLIKQVSKVVRKQSEKGLLGPYTQMPVNEWYKASSHYTSEGKTMSIIYCAVVVGESSNRLYVGKAEGAGLFSRWKTSVKTGTATHIKTMHEIAVEGYRASHASRKAEQKYREACEHFQRCKVALNEAQKEKKAAETRNAEASTLKACKKALRTTEENFNKADKALRLQVPTILSDLTFVTHGLKAQVDRLSAAPGSLTCSSLPPPDMPVSEAKVFLFIVEWVEFPEELLDLREDHWTTVLGAFGEQGLNKARAAKLSSLCLCSECCTILQGKKIIASRSKPAPPTTLTLNVLVSETTSTPAAPIPTAPETPKPTPTPTPTPTAAASPSPKPVPSPATAKETLVPTPTQPVTTPNEDPKPHKIKKEPKAKKEPKLKETPAKEAESVPKPKVTPKQKEPPTKGPVTEKS
ncbi:hypothetical protein Pelo_11915 [Pelomyxa schiedti]|nr:hypothetical protein Pelo_11915 [Pelomyxa schiedti]